MTVTVTVTVTVMVMVTVIHSSKIPGGDTKIRQQASLGGRNHLECVRQGGQRLLAGISEGKWGVSGVKSMQRDHEAKGLCLPVYSYPF